MSSLSTNRVINSTYGVFALGMSIQSSVAQQFDLRTDSLNSRKATVRVVSWENAKLQPDD